MTNGSVVQNPARRLRWLPNALTIARLAALPLLLVVLVRAPGPASVTAGVLFGVIGATDFLDGRVARALNAESAFGRIADPLADRLLVAVGLVGLLLLNRVGWGLPVILIGRDVVLMLGFLLLARAGVLMRVDLAGKISSALTMIATGGCLVFAGLWVEVLLWLAVVLALATLVHYVALAVRHLRGRRRAVEDSGSIVA